MTDLPLCEWWTVLLFADEVSEKWKVSVGRWDVPVAGSNRAVWIWKFL
jgi:hypothetical protein